MEKKPVLIFHVGTAKTGSTALQICMEKNQKFFMENKICYAGFDKRNKNHFNLMCSLIYEYFKLEQITVTPENEIIKDMISNPPEEIIMNMKRVFRENNCDTMVISQESFFDVSWGSTPHCANTEQLLIGRHNYCKNYFKKMFNEFDIKIVVYLRRQDNYVESLYNEFVKGISEKSNHINIILDNFPDIKLNNCKKYIIGGDNAMLSNMFNCMIDLGYYTNLSEWSEIYGKENIIVRPYEKSCLPNGIEYDFFVNVLGLDKRLLSDLEMNRRLNESISKDIIEYKMAAKLFNLAEEIKVLNNSAPSALAYLAENNRKNILTAKQAEDLLEYYKKDNEKIAKEYLNREDGILFYEKPREEKDDYPGLSTQAALDISRELVLLIKNKELNEQAKSKELQSKLEAERAKSKELQSKLEAERAKSKELRDKLEAERNHVNNLLNSTSWKITKPIRFLKRLIPVKK